jgi:Immunity protein 21
MHFLGNIPFIEAAGGPFIAVPSSAVPLWEGIDHPRNGRVIEVSWQWDPSGPATDYDRACCASNELLSTITMGSDFALVFRAMTNAIGWVPFRDATIGGIFVTQLSVDDESRCEEEIYRLMTVDFGPAVARWDLHDAGACLFHAAEAGASVGDGDVLALDLPAGRYEVQVQHYDEREVAEMVLYKLVIAGTAHRMPLVKNDTMAAAAAVTRFFDAAVRFSLEDWTRVHARYFAAKDDYWKSTCALGGVGTSALVHDDKTLTSEEREARYTLRAELSARIDPLLAGLPERRDMDGSSVHFRPPLRGIVTNTFQILWCRDQVMERRDRLLAARQYLTLYDELIDFPDMPVAPPAEAS